MTYYDMNTIYAPQPIARLPRGFGRGAHRLQHPLTLASAAARQRMLISGEWQAIVKARDAIATAVSNWNAGVR